jgi:hypothetical protein
MMRQPWPLIGRERELDAFRDALADGGQRTFLIYGPSGSGKSRLAEECVALAGQAGSCSSVRPPVIRREWSVITQSG